MSESDAKPDTRIEELLDLFHRDGGVFAALRDIKAELYALNERVSKDAKADAEDSRKRDEALHAMLDERVAHLGPRLLDMQDAVKKLAADAERSGARSGEALAALGRGVEEKIMQGALAQEKALAESSRGMRETLEKIAGALQSHGDTLDRLTTFVRESAERGDKTLAQTVETLTKRLDAIEAALPKITEAAAKDARGMRDSFEAALAKAAESSAKDVQGVREALAQNATAAEKQVKSLAAETLTLKAHFETFSEGQRAMVEYFNAQKKRDEEAALRERVAEAREANNRGAALYHRGAHEAAVMEFQRALELQPKMVEAASNLGLALSQLKRNKEAVEAFKRALALDANMGEAYHNLGILYHLNAEYAKAVEMFEAGLQKNTSDPSTAYLNLGTSYYESGKLKEAAAAWEKALEADSANEDARRALALFRKEKA